MGNTEQDAMWIEHTLETLPSVPVPAALEMRILGDFDRVAARRSVGLAGLLDRLRDAVWPGAPVWRPAAVLAEGRYAEPWQVLAALRIGADGVLRAAEGAAACAA